MTRKHAIAMSVLVGTLALGLSACSQTTSPTTTRSTASEPVTVLAVDGPESDALADGTADFTKASGIEVKVEKVARDVWGQRKVSELIQDAGQYDVVFIGGGDDALWGLKKAHVSDVSAVIDKKVLDDVLHSDLYTRDDGVLIGVPQYFNFPMFFYRQDLFGDPEEKSAFAAQYGRELAPPNSFDEMVQLAQFFHRPPELYGFCMGGTDWSISGDNTRLLYGLGGNYGDIPTGDLTMNTPENIQAMTYVQQLISFNAPGWETQSFFDCDQLMQEGKSAMYMNWLYASNTLRSTMGDKVGMAPLPGADTEIGSMIATIPEASTNKEAAGRFLTWMLSDEYQVSQSVATGNLPAREGLLSNPEIRSSLVGIEDLEKVVHHLTYNHTTWASELTSGVAEGLAKVMTKQESPSEVAKWLQDEKFAGRKAIE